jgi:hypothetical protein
MAVKFYLRVNFSQKYSHGCYQQQQIIHLQHQSLLNTNQQYKEPLKDNSNKLIKIVNIYNY